MTPLVISIGLHYHCRAGDYGKGTGDENWHAPAVREALAYFVQEGLLAASPQGCEAEYYATPALRVWVDALCAVPFPVQKWVIPKSDAA